MRSFALAIALAAGTASPGLMNGSPPQVANAGVSNPYLGTFVADGGEFASYNVETLADISSLRATGFIAAGSIDAGGSNPDTGLVYAAKYCADGGCSATLYAKPIITGYTVDAGTNYSCTNNQPHIELGNQASVVTSGASDITFRSAFANVPACNCSTTATNVQCLITATTTKVSITAVSSPGVASWICIGC